jgi:hypothetical protein
MHLPGDFRISYENFASYPRNLVHKGSYLPALDAYGLRLDNASSKLFTENDLDPNEIDVPFRTGCLPGRVPARRPNSKDKLFVAMRLLKDT